MFSADRRYRICVCPNRTAVSGFSPLSHTMINLTLSLSANNCWWQSSECSFVVGAALHNRLQFCYKLFVRHPLWRLYPESSSTSHWYVSISWNLPHPHPLYFWPSNLGSCSARTSFCCDGLHVQTWHQLADQWEQPENFEKLSIFLILFYRVQTKIAAIGAARPIISLGVLISPIGLRRHFC